MNRDASVLGSSLLRMTVLAAAAVSACAGPASAEDGKRITWQGIESFEEAYEFSGRVSSHLGNVHEYYHQITVRFVYVEETDAAGTSRWVSRKLSWDARGKAHARDFTVTICEGSGSLDLGPTEYTFGSPDSITGAQRAQLSIPCETTDFGILMGPFTRPPDRIEVPGIVSHESLRAGCSYAEHRPGYRYSVWVTPGCKCDPTLYDDYLRKLGVSRELFEHSQDLRGQRDAEIEAFVNEDVLGGGPVEYVKGKAKGKIKGKARDATVRRALTKGLESQVAWRRKLAETATSLGPAAKIGQGAGKNLLTAAELSYKGLDRARRWNDWDEEAKEAADRAADLHHEALEDFMADLAQTRACEEEWRKARAEEERLDRAKELIEEWENNQVLYRDPVRQEALTHGAAIKRALEYLSAGGTQQSGFSLRLFNVAYADTADGGSVTAERVEAAIRELDLAIAAYERLMEMILKALDAQADIDAELDAVMLAPPGLYLIAPGEPIG